MSDELVNVSGEASTSYVICGERRSRCECVLPRGHWPESAHACDEGCGGSWTYDAGGELVVVSYPTGIGTGRATSGESVPIEAVPFLDPLALIAMSMGPVRVPRGGIRYVVPPSVGLKEDVVEDGSE